MEIYKIQVVYDDKHVETVELPVEQVSQFLGAILHRQPWWDGADKNWGFFTDIEKVRFLTLSKQNKMEEAPLVENEKDEAIPQDEAPE